MEILKNVDMAIFKKYINREIDYTSNIDLSRLAEYSLYYTFLQMKKNIINSNYGHTPVPKWIQDEINCFISINTPDIYQLEMYPGQNRIKEINDIIIELDPSLKDIIEYLSPEATLLRKQQAEKEFMDKIIILK